MHGRCAPTGVLLRCAPLEETLNVVRLAGLLPKLSVTYTQALAETLFKYCAPILFRFIVLIPFLAIFGVF